MGLRSAGDQENRDRLTRGQAERTSYEDVATPHERTNNDALDCNESGPDKYVDLVLKFDKQDLITSIRKGDARLVTLSGYLNDGTAIRGADVVLLRERLIRKVIGQEK